MDYTQILKEIRRESHSVLYRIQSILYDAKYVDTFLQFPLVANERCGLWYVAPLKTAESAYFKSTDGHTGQWKFSLRRLNFHVLPLFKTSHTIVLVDSTRKGKLMPDAMLKTVPIWCAVLNYIMFEDYEGEEWKELREQNWLVTPRVMVSENEHSSIVNTIPEHVRAVRKLGLITKEALVEKLGAKKPILVQWMYPSKRDQRVKQSDEYFLICCLTASVKATAQTVVPNWPHLLPYVQGAADDHELWASKDICDGQFDHKILWEQVYEESSPDLLVIASGALHNWLTEDEFVSRVNGIYRKRNQAKAKRLWEATELGSTGIHCGKVTGDVDLRQVRDTDCNIQNIFLLLENYTIILPEEYPEHIYTAQIGCNKKGSKKLREALPQMFQGLTNPENVLVLCDSGTDISVAVVLCLLCRYFDMEWRATDSPPHVNKDVIKQHLNLILNHRKCNPSRNTLQSVNTFLI